MRMHGDATLVLPASVVTIGAFDGVHLGHQALIRRAVAQARTLGVPSVVYTFDPPPRCYLQRVPMLTPLEEKVRRLAQLGVDHVVVARFDETYMSRSAEAFIEELRALNPVEIWVGRDFRFGRGRQGGIDALAAAFHVRVMDPVCCTRGEVISSTRIRSLIAKGRREEAWTLLGGLEGFPV
ncbi:MAG TPA: adenylyltransferase/cytidyltransferase family protein [Calditerricola sp.]